MQISSFMWGSAIWLYTQVSRVEVNTSKIDSVIMKIIKTEVDKIYAMKGLQDSLK